MDGLQDMEEKDGSRNLRSPRGSDGLLRLRRGGVGARQAGRGSRPLRIVLVHVFIEPPPYGDLPHGAGPAWEGIERAHTWVEQELDKWASAARGEGISVRAVVRTGEPYRGIVDLATDERADLVVMGTHGRSGMSRILLGSVADRVLRLGPCPVLTVRTPE